MAGILKNWRFARPFTEEELHTELSALDKRPASVPTGRAPALKFDHYYSKAVIARECPGVPTRDGAYRRACELVARFEFSDPRIVVAHFDPHRPLLGRPLLLELLALGFRFLGGVRVTDVRTEDDADQSFFGFRYDTLAGHLEAGSEWFLVTKQHDSGAVKFQIHAKWRPGEFPNWWSRVGFELFGRRYQRAWHRLSYVRLRRLLGAGPLPELPPPGSILHEGSPLELASVRQLARSAPQADITERIE